MMKNLSTRMIFVLSVLMIIAACSTAEPIRRSAELSAAQLAVLQTEVQLYVKNANLAATIRKQQLLQSFKFDEELKPDIQEVLVLSLANQFFTELKKQVEFYSKAEAARDEATQGHIEQLKKLTKELVTPSEAFKTTQQALSMLAEKDEKAAERQNMFIREYASNVLMEFKKQRDSQKDGEE